MIKRLRILILLLLLNFLHYSFLIDPALAVDEARDTEVAERKLAEEERAIELAKKAEEQKLVEGARVSYEEVLRDPDNIDLNFRYARQQIAENGLMGAAGTLERILMINPKLAPVRFMYSVVLYRLDNIQEAERELTLLKEEKLPDHLQIDVEKQLKKIKLRRRLTRFRMRNSVGYGLDSNRNAAPNSKTTISRDAATPLSGTDLRRRDTNFLTVQSLNVTRDLGFQAGHEVFGDFTYFLQEQTQVDNLDLQSFGGALGGTYKSSLVNITPKVFASHLFLSRESFLRTQGVNVALDKTLSERWASSFDVNVERQDYLNISDNTTGGQRKGPEVELDLTAHYLLNSKMKVSSGIGYVYKKAKEQFYSHDGVNLKGSHLWLLGKGQYLVQSIEVGFDYYDGPDTLRESVVRRDKTLRYQASYSVPLSFFQVHKILPKKLDNIVSDMTINVTYEFYRTMSNITNFTYNNHKIQGILSKTWEF